ncbi:MAG TPA: alpha/beta hydrolase-fold protein [Cyclobacteriaceae bacterium]|nr:alpha/beta hydrolase-fold protein [Cyclobacteriaceae bacterium]
MRPGLSISIIVLFAVFACSEKKKEVTDRRITIGFKDSLHSNILNENREIWIYQPAELKPGEKCPVVYLLDGDWHFHPITGMIAQLADNSLIPRLILVGIKNTDRSRDLTPTHATKMPDGSEPDFLKTTGGGENFTRFIETELMPYIEAKYPVAPYKILIGHSFGGLFAMNTLIHHPNLFNAYISIDPSMWWDEGRLLHQTDSALNVAKLDGRILFLAVANTMTPGMDTARVVKDTASTHSHIRSILELAKLTGAKRANGLRARSKYYHDDDHGSVPFISEYDGLRFIFDYYKLKADWDQLTPIALTEHFNKISERLGYSISPPERQVDNMGHYFLRDKKLDKAQGFFELNLKNYPNSPSASDSMGDLLLAKNDTIRAMEFFKKSLAIEDRPVTRKKLDALTKK